MSSKLERLTCRTRQLTLVLALLCGLEPAASALDEPAPPRDVQRAEQHAANAYKAWGEKDYATAVALYLRAYQAAPAPDLLYNVARIYDLSLGERDTAILFYGKFADEPQADVFRRAFALRRIDVLDAAEQTQRAERTRPSSPPTTPTRRAAPEPARAEPSNAASEAAGWSGLHVGGMLTGGVGLGVLGAGVFFGVDALFKAEIARADCDGNACASERGVSAARAGARSANVAAASLGLGAVLVATGAGLLWLDAEPAQHPESQADVKWSAVATSSQLGVAVSGRW